MTKVPPSPSQLRGELATFTGSEVFYRHTFSRQVIYTEGIRFLAEVAGAYWLLDELAFSYMSEQMREACAADPRLRSMQFWTLHVTNSQGELTMRADADVEPAITKLISFTDFPLETIDIWAAYNGEFWTLYLPSEH